MKIEDITRECDKCSFLAHEAYGPCSEGITLFEHCTLVNLEETWRHTRLTWFLKRFGDILGIGRLSNIRGKFIGAVYHFEFRSTRDITEAEADQMCNHDEDKKSP